jgi:hypothetical protein
MHETVIAAGNIRLDFKIGVVWNERDELLILPFCSAIWRKIR